MSKNIKLGDKVRDNISGLEGIAVARTEWLHGCIRIAVQPEAKDNKVPDSVTFDEPQLKLVKKIPVLKEKERNHGAGRQDITQKDTPMR